MADLVLKDRDGTQIIYNGIEVVSIPNAEGGTSHFLNLETGGIPNGGTAGQVLKKLSETDHDVGWEDYFTASDKAEIVAEVINSLGGNPVFGYVDANNNIIVSGNLADGTYTVKYEMEDESTVDIGNLVLGGDEQSYTNLADPTSDDWQDGHRLSIGSGGTLEFAGHVATNYIPCKQGDVIRVKGLAIHDSSDTGGGTSSSRKIVWYNSSKTKILGLYGAMLSNSSQAYGQKVSVNGDISTYTIALANDEVQYADSNCAYIRLDGVLLDGYTSNDVIITINEEIE
jgi:hypothetical protein